MLCKKCSGWNLQILQKLGGDLVKYIHLNASEP